MACPRAWSRPALALSSMLLTLPGCSFALDLEPRSCQRDVECSVDGSSVCNAGICEEMVAVDPTSGGSTGGEPGSSSTGATVSPGSDGSSEGTFTTDSFGDSSTGCPDGECASTSTTGLGESTGGESSTGEAPMPVSLILNNDFESGLAGWTAWGEGVLISVVTEMPHGGAQSAAATARAAEWNGIAATVTQRIVKGATYEVSGFVRLGGTDEVADVRLSRKMACFGETDSYTQLNTVTATSTEWVEAAGVFSVPETCELVELTLYFEGAVVGAGETAEFVDIHVDDVFADPIL